MTQTRVDYEFPFRGVNGPALRVSLASTFDAIDQADVGLHHGRGHPDATSDGHVVGIIFDLDPTTVSQTNVDDATAEVSSTLGVRVRECGWGSHDPDYLGEYGQVDDDF